MIWFVFVFLKTRPFLNKLQHDPASRTVDTKTFSNHVWSCLDGIQVTLLTVPLSVAATTTCVGGCSLSVLYSCCTQGQDRRDTLYVPTLCALWGRQHSMTTISLLEKARRCLITLLPQNNRTAVFL